MPSFSSVDELRAAVGEILGPSAWLEISQERIDRFADATGDHQWIHVDPERAVAGPFGATIAHGYLTLSLLPLLTKQYITLVNTVMTINYGLDRVRFVSPVPVGSWLRASSTILAVEGREDEAQVSVRTTVETDGGARPACVADHLIRARFALRRQLGSP